MLQKTTIQLIFVLAFMTNPLTGVAHNKVVVVPLLGDDAPTSRAVFVTQNKFTGGQLTENQADNICQFEANFVRSKVKGKIFKAWRSHQWERERFTSSDTTDIFVRSKLPYKRVDGVKVADDFDSLLKEPYLDAPINLTSKGELNETLVWTGIADDGFMFYGIGSCKLWTSSQITDGAQVGNSQSTDGTWTDQVRYACNNAWALYCFEQ